MIKLRDGVHFDLQENVLIADGNSSTPNSITFVSHAHMDHIPHKDSSKIITSKETSKFIEERTDIQVDQQENYKSINLIKSGHILGSRSALVKEHDQRILYTGDISTRDRAYLNGFNPPTADTLVIESTYGKPSYVFPQQDQINQNILNWIKKQKTTFLFCYSLGKSQKIQYLIQKNLDKEIITHNAIHQLNRVYEKIKNIQFNDKHISKVHKKPYKQEIKTGKKTERVYLFPSHLSTNKEIKELSKKQNANKAGFSGWAINKSYLYRKSLDKAFPYSDHCDFTELLEVIQEVDPNKIYTYHGFSNEFAKTLKRDYDYNAQPLKKHQKKITDY
ncbi:MAG: 5'-3' Exoribonuclease of the beta-lactamase fold involved in RNA processing [Candidatus Methanohalarchaeum thermophilum]|uniref:5'-3' Exoribonuclease of the beta-lactamase fold involved in RNA processing n=1 Tax=Methanohalarchaeum thermophilum TaxID=1903181 RepID=A0A1Q6DXJ9_METT1|nr:MAG: 5'-3' Exoribonuclease of the beta-lactamase fold involved in RNA processing [Candidatus Methanohalarchaeum thermophilum]